MVKSKFLKFFIMLLIFFFAFPVAYPKDDKFLKRDRAYYKKRYEDPVIKEMEEANKKKKEEAEKLTAEIRKRQEEESKKEEKKVLSFNFTNVKKPTSPDVFKKAFHFPPVAQYLTGTCWSFSTTSFLESEVYRIHGKKVKLSEMFTVYCEYLEKTKGFIRERGNVFLGEGSESDAVTRIMKEYGAMPEEAYKGVITPDGRHDHSEMFEKIEKFLQFIKTNNYWDEEEALEHVKVILNKYMGRPPEKFSYEGKEYTPKTFLSDYLKINPDDYVSFMSTLSIPFYTKGEFKVPDNWWHSKEYYNVPLEEFYRIIKNSILNGYTIAIGGDVSEPGYNGFEDSAIVPTFDIPPEYIDQSSREFRFYNNTSTDDHGVHLVGYAKIDNWDWFLIKDSARSSRWGKFEGYYFYREDYIKLKMLSFMVHKDAVKDVLSKFKE